LPKLVAAEIEAGTPPDKTLQEGMVAALGTIGERFSEGTLFVPEMLMAAKAVQAGLEVLRPVLADTGIKPIRAPGDFAECRAIGDDWYERGDSAVLWVPSVVSPYESNSLFDQRHDDFRAIIVHDARPARVEPRLRPDRG
jgi:hypothetical protein